MKNINRFKVFSVFLIAAYLLAACGGTLPQAETAAKGPKVQANVVAFTGIVEAINGTEWVVSGQKFTLDPQASLDPNIAVGDEVTVEASVSADGTVVALKVESSANDDAVSTPSADASSTPDPVGTPSPDASETPDVSSPQDDSQDDSKAAGADENEVFGAVEAMTADTITVDGVTYNLADFTEFKDGLVVGDTVKLHVIVNADGTFTVREIEKSSTFFDDNSNSGGSDDGPNHDANDDNSNNNFDDDSDDDGSNNSGSGSTSGFGGD